MDPLEILYERPDLPLHDLPASLEETYGGSLGFAEPRLIANFVASVDGVVDDPSIPNAPSFISRGSEHDRFVMGLLRACAGAVLIGGGTLRAEPEHRWIPSHIFPDRAEDYRHLRDQLGLPPEPELAIVTSSGDLDPGAEALGEALVLTSYEGAAEIRRRKISARDVVELGSRDLDPGGIVDAIRKRGHSVILSEGGPHLTSQLLRERLLDELFLTVSPIVLGRDPDRPRAGLADSHDLVPLGPPSAELMSARRGASHLFLRYTFPA